MSQAADAPLVMDQTVHRESRRLFAIAFSILRDAAEAEDAVQETMVKAWKSWNWDEDGTPAPAWITRICVNHCINRRQGLLARLRLLASVPTHHVAQRSTSEDSPIHLDLARAYPTLSTKQRAAVALHYYHGYSVDECAALMGCRSGTVRSHLARALDGLRQEMSHA